MRHLEAENSRQSAICNHVLVAIGGNLRGHRDSPLAQIKAARQKINDLGLEVTQCARLYRTPSFPPGSGPDFVNSALECVTELAPDAILSLLQRVEAEAGRTRDQRWAPRILDLDLLAVGDMILPDKERFQRWADLPLQQQMNTTPEQLILPHPRLHERPFVLVPLMDIAPDWRHPVLERTVAQMHAALDPADLAEIRPIIT